MPHRSAVLQFVVLHPSTPYVPRVRVSGAILLPSRPGTLSGSRARSLVTPAKPWQVRRSLNECYILYTDVPNYAPDHSPNFGGPCSEDQTAGGLPRNHYDSKECRTNGQRTRPGPPHQTSCDDHRVAAPRLPGSFQLEVTPWKGRRAARIPKCLVTSVSSVGAKRKPSFSTVTRRLIITLRSNQTKNTFTMYLSI